jgi:hypothetical protein
MLAGADGGRLYRSTDTGANWSEVQPAGDANKAWFGCSVDDDGSVMLAGTDGGGRLYRYLPGGFQKIHGISYINVAKIHRVEKIAISRVLGV